MPTIILQLNHPFPMLLPTSYSSTTSNHCITINYLEETPSHFLFHTKNWIWTSKCIISFKNKLNIADYFQCNTIIISISCYHKIRKVGCCLHTRNSGELCNVHMPETQCAAKLDGIDIYIHSKFVLCSYLENTNSGQNDLEKLIQQQVPLPSLEMFSEPLILTLSASFSGVSPSAEFFTETFLLWKEETTTFLTAIIVKEIIALGYVSSPSEAQTETHCNV